MVGALRNLHFDHIVPRGTVNAPPRLDDRRQELAPRLGDLQRRIAGLGRRQAGPVPVELSHPSGAALIAVRTDAPVVSTSISSLSTRRTASRIKPAPPPASNVSHSRPTIRGEPECPDRSREAGRKSLGEGLAAMCKGAARHVISRVEVGQ